MVRAIYGTGVLSQWLQEIPDGGTIDVISSFASPPLMLGHHNIFDIHYPGNFLFYSGQCTRDLLEMLITEGAGDIRIFSGAYLHAKIYRGNWPNGHEDFIDNPSEERTFWAIGSANFTRPGLNSSTECITVFENGDSCPFTSEI